MSNTKFKTLEEAHTFLRENFDKGENCPCCGQFVKLYKRKLNSGMAITLIRVYKAHGLSWVNVKDFLRENKHKNTHDWTLLRHWGLIREASHDPLDETKKSSGVWKITVAGERFVKNEVKTLSHIKHYNGNASGFTGEEITIVEALGRKFNYPELMAI